MEKHMLCLGDSLTEGYYDGGRSFHPYTKKLQTLLNKDENETKEHWTIENAGVSGACLIQTTGLPWLASTVAEVVTRHKPYDAVVFLAGSNDLGLGRSADQIWKMWKTVVTSVTPSLRAHCVVCTVPDSAGVLPSLRENRSLLNAKIRQTVEANPQLTLVDLEHELPYSDNSALWDDGLHFTPEGYDRVAELIFQCF
jgi:lysophospholipase L1-like esterase